MTRGAMGLVFSLAAFAIAVTTAVAVAGRSMQAGAGEPVGTGFTFQGRVTEDGVPVDGACDLAFALFANAAGTQQIGADDALPAPVPVTNGLFTAMVNASGAFGPDAFTGEQRWLRVSARCPEGTGEFSSLEPLTPITPVPYSLFAMSAGKANEAQHAQSADTATSADTAGHAGTATFAEIATSTGFAANAGALDGHLASEFAKYKRIVLVNAGGTPQANGQALVDALASITGASAIDRYLLLLEPGHYRVQTPLVLKPFVELQGLGTIDISSDTTANVIVGAAGANLTNLNVWSTVVADQFVVDQAQGTYRRLNVTGDGALGGIRGAAALDLHEVSVTVRRPGQGEAFGIDQTSGALSGDDLTVLINPNVTTRTGIRAVAGVTLKDSLIRLAGLGPQTSSSVGIETTGASIVLLDRVQVAVEGDAETMAGIRAVLPSSVELQQSEVSVIENGGGDSNLTGIQAGFTGLSGSEVLVNGGLSRGIVGGVQASYSSVTVGGLLAGTAGVVLGGFGASFVHSSLNGGVGPSFTGDPGTQANFSFGSLRGAPPSGTLVTCKAILDNTNTFKESGC